MVSNGKVKQWVNEMVKLCRPDRVVWCDGSEEERKRLEAEAILTGELTELNEDVLPGCLLHRTAKNDVARTEHLTFICTSKQEDVGPTNNWMSPEEAYAKLGDLFDELVG
jgi:phosphoenolpyruvate carboxykinase (GTP)